jgi:hypothetical protein
MTKPCEWTACWPHRLCISPTPLILAVLNKVVMLCLIAPCWPNQAWFPVLLELLSDHPRRLSEWDRLLGTQSGRSFTRPPLSSSFTLGDYRVFSPRERLFGRRYQEDVLASKGVDHCFLRQQVVRLQRLVQETRVFSGLSHSTPVPRLLEKEILGPGCEGLSLRDIYHPSPTGVLGFMKARLVAFPSPVCKE